MVVLMYSLFFVFYYNGMYTYIPEYMQACNSIGTDIHINTNMKMVVCIRRRIHVYISISVMHVRIRLNISAIIIYY